jgi:transcriptional regulator with XRE-family HTH domain
MNFGSELRSARRAAGLTQADLARRAGTSQATLSAYENGHKNPSLATLDRLLAASGARIAVAPRERPVVTPSAAELSHRGRVLTQVLDLAASLPTRHEPVLRYPSLVHKAGSK